MRNGTDIQYKEALRRAAALCSQQEQCSFQIREKLNTWSMSESDTERIIASLEKDKFLDDSRYATFYVRDKFRLNRWGKIKIRVMLRQKGIPDGTINKALEQIDPDEYIQVCTDLIQQKKASLTDTNQFSRKGKLFRYAAGRGFESELIYRILNMEGSE